MSYLAKHRPICAVLDEMKTLASTQCDYKMIALCDEAIGYARRMSARLMEVKRAEEEARERRERDGPTLSTQNAIDELMGVV